MHAPDKLRSRRTGIHPRRGRRHRLAPTRWMNYTRVSFTIPHAGCGCNCFGSYGSSECLSCALPNGQLVWPDRRSPQRTPWRPAPRSRAGIRPSWRALQLPADLILGPYPQPSAAQAPLGASLWSSLAPVMVALLVAAAGGGSARCTGLLLAALLVVVRRRWGRARWVSSFVAHSPARGGQRRRSGSYAAGV
jgi:hypothetical protein